MNPNIVVPFIRLILDHDPSIIEPYVDRLVSMLISVNCLFVGNYTLKNQTWELVVSILDHVNKRQSNLCVKTVTRILKLKVVDALFGNFEDQQHHERSETESVKRAIKDSGSSSNIDSIPKKETERLVYARKALCLQTYIRYSGKESIHVLIEMLYKLY
jgi:hypothetical protein